jgi:hypothetical protein
MSQIRPYEGQVSAQGGMPSQNASPADAGGPGLTNLGQAIQSAGQSAGAVQRIVQNNATRAAITDVHTFLAGARSTYTQKAIDVENQADPKSTNVWDQFHSGGNADAPTEGSFKWYLDSYRSQITNGQALQTFDRGAADLTAQFGIHFAQVQSKMAGVHAKNQAVQMIDAAQTTVQTDPSQYESVMAATMKAIDDPASDYGRAGTEQRQAIKQMATNQIASSTVRGMIGDSPQHALHSLEKGEWDNKITGEQKITLMSAAETGVRAQEVEARRAEAERLRQKKALYDSTDQSLGSKYALHEGNPGNSKFPPVTATEIGKLMLNDQLDGSTGRAWIHMIESNSKERTLKNDETTSAELFRRIKLPYGDKEKLLDLNEVTRAASKMKLTPARFNFLRNEFVKAQTDEGASLAQASSKMLDGFKSSITKSNPAMGKLDTEGDILYGQFQVFASQEEERLRKANEDPRTLYQRESKNYIGNQVSQFQKTMQESIQSISQNLRRQPTTTAPVARLPNETPEQYLERKKKQ